MADGVPVEHLDVSPLSVVMAGVFLTAIVACGPGRVRSSNAVSQ
jgi:hypothetical protein